MDEGDKYDDALLPKSFDAYSTDEGLKQFGNSEKVCILSRILVDVVFV